MLGYEENEKTLYDCTRILVAANVQDAIIASYKATCPKATTEQIIILLAISGPKVAEDLKENEAVLQEGFVFTENDRIIHIIGHWQLRYLRMTKHMGILPVAWMMHRKETVLILM